MNYTSIGKSKKEKYAFAWYRLKLKEVCRLAKFVVCGSIAFDNLMEFPGDFGEHIIPDKIDSLSVSFLVNKFQKVRGGTAPNISYNLALVGEIPTVFGSVGSDFSEYNKWLNENGVSTRYVKVLENDYTANCFVTTDKKHNQIITFYPGAMSNDKDLSILDINKNDVDMVIIAPTDPEAMVKWALECQQINIPYMFDPGMQIPRLSKDDLREGILGSRIAIFNSYEYEMMIKKTGLNKEEILSKVELLVVTDGEKGSVLSTRDETVNIPVAKANKVIDPTGAGDAYRAGLLKGYMEGVSIDIMGRYASITGVYAVEHKGATVHKYTIDEMNKRYIENFGGI